MSGRNLDTETLSYLPDAPSTSSIVAVQWPIHERLFLPATPYHSLYLTPSFNSFVQYSMRRTTVSWPLLPHTAYISILPPNSHSFDSTHHEKSN
ncbi:hypothetical protein BS17DRAFT_782627 [Gyrodon lividus]|nr:hypothetical protein BS17DRAFT_782627 [Gyrodon lividus]